MGRKKTGEENVRKLSKVGDGNSYVVTIPMKWVKRFGWDEGMKLVVRKYKGEDKLVIEDWEENSNE